MEVPLEVKNDTLVASDKLAKQCIGVSYGLIPLKNSDGQKFAFGIGKPFSNRDILQTGFGNRRLSGIAFCPIGGIGLLTEIFNGIRTNLPFAPLRSNDVDANNAAVRISELRGGKQP